MSSTMADAEIDANQPSPGGMELPPVAPMLMQSLRAVGYTTASALADIVDNSVAAGAKSIRIAVSLKPHPIVAIVDDGQGMNAEALVSAMRFGSRDPRDARSGIDLGRFGLGLKTASLSQCRRLTVISSRDGEIASARWDLDECDRRGTWWLERPEERNLPAEPLEMLRSNLNGTAVVWENIDRVLPPSGIGRPQDLEDAVVSAADHLALAFHRYLAGEFIPGFGITLNERPLPVLDPFLSGHTKGQTLHYEKVMVEGSPVIISPFVLPYPGKLKPAEMERAGGRETLRTAHGFYIYRGGRLVVPGGWFRIVPSDDLVRLARIRVDVPVELDHLWKVDIRKAVAEPPPALRPHLKRIVGDVTVRSRKVYTYKGLPADEADRVPLWVRHDLRDRGAAWRINRDHPLIQAALSSSGSIAETQSLLRLLEDNLPIHDIHIHTANDQPVAEGEVPGESELEELARRILDALGDEPDARERILSKLVLTEPFSRNPEISRNIVERLRE